MPFGVRRHGRRTFREFSFSIIFAVFFVFSTSVAVGVAHQLHQLSINTLQRASMPRYLVMLVLDGAEPQYLHLNNLPHLQALTSSGTQYSNAFTGILESETPSGHTAISTGSTPAHNGLLGFNFIHNDTDAVRLFNPDVVRAGAIEHVIQQSGAPTLAGLFKAKYPKAKVIAVSGHKYYAADPLGGPAADYIMYYAADPKGHYIPTAIPGHVPPQSILNDPSLTTPTATLPPGSEDTLAVKLAMASFAKVRQQITLINLPEFDWPLGHVYGGEAARAQTLMQDFDRDLGMIEDIFRKAGVLDRTLFVITADHGMAQLQYQIPDSVMDDAITASGTTSLETTYSTAGYIWLQNTAKAQTVADGIVAKREPHIQSVYYKVTAKTGDSYVRAGGLPISAQTDSANQYLLASFQGGNAPSVVALCTEDASFVTKGAETWKGNHGGAAWNSQHMPLLMSGPGIQSGQVLQSPARLEDIAPTVLSLFGIASTGMQGTVLADALQNPTAPQRAAQTALNQALTPVVSALATQSRKEVGGR